jgi:hypothetical protein
MTDTKCSHIIVEDYIDIDPDKSIQIFYCSKCFSTFINNKGDILLCDKPREPIKTPIEKGSS